jgi:uncharacterized membrane protein
MTSSTLITVPGSQGVLARAAKWAAIAILAVIALRFFWLHALRYTNVTEHTYRRYWPYRGWLMVHIIGGSLALLLGPLQFFSGLRRWNMKLHRWAGRLYLAGVVIGSVAATYMGFVTKYRAFGISLVAMAFAWLSCASMAYIAIRRRQVPAHKEWMIRSYVVTYGFVVFRVIQDSKLLESFKVESLALLFAEMALQWRRTVGPARARPGRSAGMNATVNQRKSETSDGQRIGFQET